MTIVEPSGIIFLNKPKGKTSFSLVSALRRICDIRKIGHAGTLDPFATGVMILLVGKHCTRLSERFLQLEKEYIATLHLGIRTTTYDCEGESVETSTVIPSLPEIEKVLQQFQGSILQVPPMFSAKKVGGKKLYTLARKGIEIERKAQEVLVHSHLLYYEYPYLSIRFSCSKGTYIRSLAEDIGMALGCGAHLSDLSRTKVGCFTLSECLDGSVLFADTPPKAQDLPLRCPSTIPLLQQAENGERSTAKIFAMNLQ